MTTAFWTFTMDVVITINMKKIQFFAPVSTSASDTCAGGLEIEKNSVAKMFLHYFWKKNVASCAMDTRADTSKKIVWTYCDFKISSPCPDPYKKLTPPTNFR